MCAPGGGAGAFTRFSRGKRFTREKPVHFQGMEVWRGGNRVTRRPKDVVKIVLPIRFPPAPTQVGVVKKVVPPFLRHHLFHDDRGYRDTTTSYDIYRVRDKKAWYHDFYNSEVKTVLHTDPTLFENRFTITLA
jgi:hypothetical protein